MQQKQKRGHHFIFKADHKTHSKAKKKKNGCQHAKAGIYFHCIMQRFLAFEYLQVTLVFSAWKIA
jgi:hypothetical protein